MSVTDAVGSIQQIQSTLTRLFGPKEAVAATAASASAFATALTGAQSVSTGVANPGGATGADVVADAKRYLGVPYVFGGEDASGMDCSGLVQKVFSDLGVSMPRIVPDQAAMGTEVPSLADARPGDLIVLKGAHHIVIYAGDGKVIHAPSEGRNVQIADAWMDDSQIETIRRIVPASAPATDSSLSSSSIAAATLAAIAGGTGTEQGAIGSSSTSLMAALQAALATGSLK